MSVAALTASDLRDGEAVFWSLSGWAKRFADAELFETPAGADAALEAARRQPTVVVDPYLIEVVIEDGLPIPTAYRERVRALGPTIHPELGKQGEGGALVAALQRHQGGARSAGRLGLIRRK